MLVPAARSGDQMDPIRQVSPFSSLPVWLDRQAGESPRGPGDLPPDNDRNVETPPLAAQPTATSLDEIFGRTISFLKDLSRTAMRIAEGGGDDANESAKRPDTNT